MAGTPTVISARGPTIWDFRFGCKSESEIVVSSGSDTRFPLRMQSRVGKSAPSDSDLQFGRAALAIRRAPRG
eukprot:1248913-Lingulodinium_polyedra.AAC.1